MPVSETIHMKSIQVLYFARGGGGGGVVCGAVELMLYSYF